MKPEQALILSFYKEIAEIDEIGHVFLVQHIETKQIFVKKILSIYNRPIYELLMEKRFRNIPRLFHCIEEDGKLILIEEYIKGRSLEQILEEEASFSVSRAAEIVCRLCDILSPLHSQNPPLIHRDIKPSNILISSDGVVKLIDFNAAKAFDEQKTQDTILMGTADYAAPEQYGFRQSDIRTDLYALGVLLNRMLTGKLPKEQMYQGCLTDVIKTCVQMEPEKRFSSAAALKQALLAALPDSELFASDLCASDRPKEKADRKKEQKSSEIDWRPPGFRGKKLWKKLLAGFGYGIAAYICATLTLENQVSAAQLYVNRIFCAILICGLIAFYGNYLGMQRYFPFMQGKVPRFLGYLTGTVLILFFVVGILVLIENLVWPV